MSNRPQLTTPDPLGGALLKLYVAAGLEDFPQRLMTATKMLLPDCAVGYGVMNPTTEILEYRGDLAPLPWGDRQKALINQDPTFQYLKGGGTEPVLRISDFVSFRRFRNSSYYQECFRPLGVRHVSLQACEIRVRPENAKNAIGQVIPLIGRRLEIIQLAYAQRWLDCPYVFHRDGQSIGDDKKAWATAIKSAGQRASGFITCAALPEPTGRAGLEIPPS